MKQTPLMWLAIVILGIIGTMANRQSSQRIEALHAELYQSQAAQSFAFHAARVMHNFGKVASACTLQEQSLAEIDSGNRFVIEINYAMPESIPAQEIVWQQQQCIHPLIHDCGAYNPNRGHNWRTKVIPDFARVKGEEIRSGRIRIEKVAW